MGAGHGRDAPVVVCGAGIAGIAAAYHLVRAGMRDVVLVDERAPLSLTSDKSTECYRNWWPSAAMTALANRSIDLMEDLARESGNRIVMSRRGYLFASATEDGVEALRETARRSCSLGAGPLREHPPAGGCGYRPAATEGFEGEPRGADLITDRALIRRHFPYLAPATRVVVHARRCGWLSAQQLGMLILERARAAGVRLLRGRVAGVDTRGGRVRGVEIEGPGGGERLAAEVLVNAAGPFLAEVGALLGADLPVHCEPHVKLAFHDRLGRFPAEAPLVIWADPLRLPWMPDERAALAAEPAGRALLAEFPAGVHARPAGGGWAMVYWTYDSTPGEPVFPLRWDRAVPEIYLRGAAVMIPALTAYLGCLPRPVVDGGYYAKTPDNRPLIGPLEGLEGAYLVGALSGFGIMTACAAGELVAAQVSGAALPAYAAAFAAGRLDDPGWRERLDAGGGDGQL